jgi:hypothetical protein
MGGVLRDKFERETVRALRNTEVEEDAGIGKRGKSRVQLLICGPGVHRQHLGDQMGGAQARGAGLWERVNEFFSGVGFYPRKASKACEQHTLLPLLSHSNAANGIVKSALK